MTAIQPKILKCYRLCFFQPANYFCPFSLVPRNQLLSVAAACKVLIEFSLLRLENPDEACAVSQVRETNCTGDCNFVGLKSTKDSLKEIQHIPATDKRLCFLFKHFSCLFVFKLLLVKQTLTCFFWPYVCILFLNGHYLLNPRVKLSDTLYFSTETPDSSNKRTLHWLQQTRSHRNHYFHCYDEICQVASNRQDPFRW